MRTLGGETGPAQQQYWTAGVRPGWKLCMQCVHTGHVGPVQCVSVSVCDCHMCVIVPMCMNECVFVCDYLQVCPCVCDCPCVCPCV